MKGYLETKYLDNAYLVPVADDGRLSQVKFVITKEASSKFQASLNLTKEASAKSQVEVHIKAAEKLTLAQATPMIGAIKEVKAQVSLRINAKENPSHAQLKAKINGKTKATKAEVRLGRINHVLSKDLGYLTTAYCERPYLAPYIGAELRSQVDRKTSYEVPFLSQVEIGIKAVPSGAKSQVENKITKERLSLAQVNRIRLSASKSQATIALYNTDNLRILYDFASRGTGANAGANWSASSQMVGDFSPNNLNSDIVEQVWRSDNLKTGVILSCDTGIPQGVFLDTLAILNHNLTTSAVVQFQGSDVSDFASVGFDERLLIKKKNTYWISPSLPLQSYRYWRILINDATNANDYLEIGTIVFGKSMIFHGECFVDEVQRSTKHFADRVETEGFTNVTVDRAVKFAVGLEFRNLAYERGNYNKMKDLFDTCRTGLKALWIPTPKYPDRFAVFGKLTSIPPERHNVKGESLDFVDFSVEVDESL